MGTDHWIIPYNNETLASDGITDFLNIDLGYGLTHIPYGRDPRPSEIRDVVEQLDYEFTEDFRVRSEDDGTAIILSNDAVLTDSPTTFYFEHGNTIVTNIMQVVANRCGSYVHINLNIGIPLLLIPDDVFPTQSTEPLPDDYFLRMCHRLPIMLERLPTTSLEDTILILSQIRQAFLAEKPIIEKHFTHAVRKAPLPLKELLSHTDSRVRLLAFDIRVQIIKFYSQFPYVSPWRGLWNVITNESDPTTKTIMLLEYEKLLETAPRTYFERDTLEEYCETESSAICLIAARILTYGQLGYLSNSMRSVLHNALMQPDKYKIRWRDPFFPIDYALDTIDRLMLKQRINLLLNALPYMQFAVDGNKVLEYLFDAVFFGVSRKTHQSSPKDYHRNPTKLTATDLLSTQRDILQAVMDIDLPWMVHSNLLQKYGLPPTRAAVREMLGIQK